LVERWYSTRKFEYDDGDEKYLTKFILGDVFRKGLDPGTLVRHIHMEVQTDSYYRRLKYEDEFFGQCAATRSSRQEGYGHHLQQ
jgi:hypothetical protein